MAGKQERLRRCYKHLEHAVKAYKEGEYLLFLRCFYKAEAYFQELEISNNMFDMQINNFCHAHDVSKTDLLHAACGVSLEIKLR